MRGRISAPRPPSFLRSALLCTISLMRTKRRRKFTLTTLAQGVFLCAKFFLRNRLLSYAGACSFSFLFSFIPVFLLIIVVLVRVLHASPEVVTSIFREIPELGKMPSESIIRSVQSVRSVGVFELLIGIFVFWMARRFFASIFDSMQNIFHAQTRRRAASVQALTLAVEAASVFVAAAVIFAYISLETLLNLPVLEPFFRRIPALSFFFNGIFLAAFVKHLPDILIFAVVLTMYRTVPGTRPRLRLCALAAFTCTFSFGVFRDLMHLFLNVNNYSIVYGMLGQVILTFMDIFFFFTFFLFFAQCIFVFQFFDELLLGELYLLPKAEEASATGWRRIAENPDALAASAKRLLFMRPDSLLAGGLSVISLADGETLFRHGDAADCAYYVAGGQVEESRRAGTAELGRGDFAGEVSCVLGKPRDSAARAKGRASVIRISADTFRMVVRQNPDAAHKVLSQVSAYFDDAPLE